MFTPFRRPFASSFHPSPVFQIVLFLGILLLVLLPKGRGEAYQWTNFAGLPGTSGSTDATGNAARFYGPWGVCVDGSGNIYVADTDNFTIRKITSAGVVTTLAGSAGAPGSTDGPGAAARFYVSRGVCVDATGNIYVADSVNQTIRKITSAGVVTTLAGSAGLRGSADGTGNAARFNQPESVCVDGSGNVYVADTYNSTIRKITSAGVVTTLAGSAGVNGGADGTGAAARFNTPGGVCVDGSGNIYVADTYGYTIRKITSAGVVTTLAGTAGFSGYADGTGPAARFNQTESVCVDGSGNLYVPDRYNYSIRKITSAGVVTTIGGNRSTTGSSDGIGQAATFNYPNGIAVTSAGQLFVADSSNNRITSATIAPPEVTINTPSVSTAGATLNGFVTPNGNATAAQFEYRTSYGGYGSYGSTAGVTLSPFDGLTPQSVSASITGLAANTRYYYRLSASNLGGTVMTGEGSFTTGIQPPSVTTAAASGIDLNSATFNGTINPLGISSTAYFEWGTSVSSFPNQLPLTGTFTGSSVVAVSASVAGFSAGTTYYYRLVAAYTGGLSNSLPAQSFTTLGVPVASAVTLGSVTATSAQVSGTVNAMGSSTSAFFEYGTDGVNFPFAVATTPADISGSSAVAVSATLTGLTQGSAYSVRLRATNTAGTTIGVASAFTTGSLPTATASPASGVGLSAATLNGLADGRGLTTALQFEFGTDGINFSPTPSTTPATVTGSSAVSASVGSLTTGSTYYYRLRATNSAGATVSNVVAFTTAPPPIPAPSAATGGASNQTATGATVTGSVNANGASTTVLFEYSTDAANLSQSAVATPSMITGSSTMSVGVTLTGLLEGTTYFYRVRAISSGGSVPGAVQTFTTLTLPTMVAGAATNISIAGATLSGTVNARGTSTTVTAELSIDEAFATSSTVAATPSPASGSFPTAVTATSGALAPGALYYYRFRAQSVGGMAVSDIKSLITPAQPLVTLKQAIALDTITAQVFGEVNANGVATTVSFEYRAAGGNFSSVPAEPATLTTTENALVNATLNGLSQGTTYFYRLKAVSVGGTATTSEGTFELGSLSGFLRQAPGAPPTSEGFLLVNLTPPNIGSGWRLVGEQQWRPSGVPLGGLAGGDREIEYKAVRNFLQPPREVVTIANSGPATVVNQEYLPVAEPGAGSLSVILKPSAIALPSLPDAQRAQWRLAGEGDADWQNSEATITALTAGVYLVECKPIPGRETPAPLSLSVTASPTASATATYFLSDPAPGVSPEVLPFETATTAEGLPYAFVGQLRSDVGVGTGFVVRPRVVVTAAHAVFDDSTLTYVTGLQWVFQRDRGTYEPTPQLPHGFYLSGGYAAQRGNENTPGQSSPASQELDAATVYFLADAARGGFSGYLASDASQNEWLLSSSLKTLVGYPIDGIPAADQGRIHATPPADIPFTFAAGHTFRTAGLNSRAGNSGGPLCVQHGGGSYYPAAIYLGGSGQTVVRAIDSTVVTLIDRAQESANGGDDNTSGGVTMVSARLSAATLEIGLIKVTLNPPDVGGWRLGTGGYLPSGATSSGLIPGSYLINFKPVAGYAETPPTTVQVTGGDIQKVTAPYVRLLPPAITSPRAVTLHRGDDFTYEIVATGGPTSFAALGELPEGVGFSRATGAFSGVPLKSGRYAFTIQAANTVGTDSATLVLQVSPQLENQAVSISQGQDLSYALQTAPDDGSVSFASGALPAGLTLVSGGVVQGAPTQAGIFSVPISITNSGGTANATLRFFIRPASAGVNSASGTVRASFTFVPVTNSDPATTFTATGLPAGLTINAKTGKIEGVPTSAGTFLVSVLATNHGDTALYPLDITIDSLLQVEQSTGGTLSGNFGSTVKGKSTHPPGTTITLQAWPDSGYYFAGWSGSVPARATILTFPIPNDDTTIRAEFRSVASAAGTYLGVATSGGRAAQIRLQATRTGNITGQLRLQGRTFPIKGLLNTDGTLKANLVAKGLLAPVPLELQLSVLLTGGAALVGTLDQGFAALPVRLDLVTPTASMRTSRYTVAFPKDISRAADVTYPQGHGYATIQLTQKGAARLAGALGDGTPFTASAQLTSAGKLSVYFEPYINGGSVAGHLVFHHDNASIPDWLDGALLWQKPDLRLGRYRSGFTADIGPVGSAYSKTNSPRTLSLTLTGAGLSSPLIVRAVVASKNRFDVNNPAVSLVMDAASGTYGGSLKLSGTKPVPLRGVYLPRQEVGFGQIVAPDATGPVDFQPAP